MKKRFCTFCENETDELHCEICGKRTIANKKYAASDEKSKGYFHDKTRYQMMEENHVHKEIEKRKQQFYKNRKEKKEMSFSAEMTKTTIVGILLVLAVLIFTFLIGE